jgi:hypothetical protein
MFVAYCFDMFMRVTHRVLVRSRITLVLVVQGVGLYSRNAFRYLCKTWIVQKGHLELSKKSSVIESH